MTDIELDWLPDNVHQINMSFSNFHNLIENKLGLDILPISLLVLVLFTIWKMEG